MKSFSVCQYWGRSPAQRLKNIEIEAFDDLFNLAFILQNSLHLGQLYDWLQTRPVSPMIAHICEPPARLHVRLLPVDGSIPVPVV